MGFAFLSLVWYNLKETQSALPLLPRRREAIPVIQEKRRGDTVRRIKQILGLVLIACVCISSTVAVQARRGQKTVVRVGFPIQYGISYLDENGNYAGYMVD